MEWQEKPQYLGGRVQGLHSTARAPTQASQVKPQQPRTRAGERVTNLLVRENPEKEALGLTSPRGSAQETGWAAAISSKRKCHRGDTEEDPQRGGWTPTCTYNPRSPAGGAHTADTPVLQPGSGAKAPLTSYVEGKSAGSGRRSLPPKPHRDSKMSLRPRRAHGTAKNGALARRANPRMRVISKNSPTCWGPGESERAGNRLCGDQEPGSFRVNVHLANIGCDSHGNAGSVSSRHQYSSS